MKPFLNQQSLVGQFFSRRSTPPTEDQIRLRAFGLWVARGRPLDGSHDQDWFEAERQLRNESELR